jgi:hypothetical protein
MTCFRDFTVPLWEIFGGNLLMFVTIAFYIAWWSVLFRPNGIGRPDGAGLLIGAAVVAGVAGIAAMSIGFNSVPRVVQGIPVMAILLGAVALYIALLAVTKTAFQRPVTSELLLITLWTALELSVIAVLQSGGRFGMGRVITLSALVVLAFLIGVVCYILHYRLDETGRFWNGLIPLIADGGVVAAILTAQALY